MSHMIISQAMVIEQQKSTEMFSSKENLHQVWPNCGSRTACGFSNLCMRLFELFEIVYICFIFCFYCKVQKYSNVVLW